MRALCGAIITAGAMIGLGLTALAYGLRFQGITLMRDALPKDAGQLLGTPALMTCLVVLLICIVIGLAVSFLGLMYHHERRHYELHGDVGRSTRTEGAGRAL